jgi:glycosyltransferase involved in cell wall biosynthesis
MTIDVEEAFGGHERLDVLIVSQPVEYGVAVCVRQQVEAAVAAGHDVLVACPDSDHGPLADWVRASGASHVALRLDRRPTPGDIRAVAALRRLARGRDGVHLHSSKAGAVGRAAVASLPRHQRPAVVFTPHSWSWQVGGRLAGLYRGVERALSARCEAIVAVSAQEAADGRAVLGARADHMTVVPNGVDRTHFCADGLVAPRDPAHPLVVCVGRLSRQKGQDVAIRALARLRARDARLRLVGDEQPVGDAAHLRSLASALDVAERIEWHGKAADTAPQLRAADVVVAPSRWEGMSLVLLEALACGAAIVATDVFGSDAVGDAGVVVPPDDVDAVARAIDTLLDDDQLRRRLGEAARRRSVAFGLDASLQRTLQLWSTVAEQRSGAARRPRRAPVGG